MLQCSTKAFKKMQHLKYLNLGNVELNGSCNHIPKSLVWLRWQGSSWSCISNNLFLEKVAVLEMPGSNLRSVWKGIRRLEHLKVLDLRQCRELNRTPNFEGVPRLEILVLEDCTNLVEVDQSIGVLTKLELLNCKNCRRLHLKLPVLKSLEELDISGCPNLGNLREVLVKFESLKVLNADGITMKDFKEDKYRWWKSASCMLRPLPRRYAHSSTGLCFDFLPKSLTTLSLVDCGLSDDIFPIDLSFLSSLRYLDLSGNPITQLHVFLELYHVTLERCTKLQSVSLGRTSILHLIGCESLEKFETEFHSKLCIIVEGCGKLVEIGGDVFKIQPIENIDKNVQKHLGLSSLESFKNTKLSLLNGLARIKYEATIQVWKQDGTHHVFLPGDEVPHWFPLRFEGEDIRFDLLHPANGQELVGFSLCLKYCLNPQAASSDLEEVVPEVSYCRRLMIINTTKRLGCSQLPFIWGIPRPGSHDNLLWLSYWRLQDLCLLQLEEGDEVVISGEMLYVDVKELGVRLIHGTRTSNTNRATAPTTFCKL